MVIDFSPRSGPSNEISFEQPLHHRVEPAGADVLGLVIHARRKVGDTFDRFAREAQLHARSVPMSAV